MTTPDGWTECRNCGQPAGPHFCGTCGQTLNERQGPLGAMLKELLSDWLSLDSRLLRSLRALLVPGRLTELWGAGKRAPYLRPFRLYLLASLVVFSTVLALDAPDARNYDVYLGDNLVSAQSAGDRNGTLQLLDTKTLYLEHLVFALHIQSAMFFALAAAWIVARLFSFELTTSIFTYLAVWFGVMTVYQAIAMRRCYRQSWWRTSAKVALVSAAYLKVLSYVLGAAMFLSLWQI